jgi:hypothetical protein
MAVVGKLFNKLNKDTSKFFNKAGKEVKMLGRGARSFGAEVGGALGSVGGEVKKAASDLEKATRGTALAPALTPALKAAELVGGVTQSGGKALKAGSQGKTKEAIRQIESGVKGVIGIKKIASRK